jgi:putative flippase GtrA
MRASAAEVEGLRGHRLARLAQQARLSRYARYTRLARYASTSVVAFGVSEATLLVLYGTGTANPTVAATLANLVGTVPSYLMSRYWIWKDAPRSRLGRQMVLYWAVSIVCMLLIGLATGAVAKLSPTGHPFHLELVALGFLVVNAVFWLAKYLLYQRVIFSVRHGGPDEIVPEPIGDSGEAEGASR